MLTRQTMIKNSDHQYFTGPVNTISNGKHVVMYDDEDMETLKLGSEN